MLPGISARGQSEIARLERESLGPGAAVEALARWERYARADRWERTELSGCSQPGCCADPNEDREILTRILGVLRSGDRESLRKRIQELDDALSTQEGDD